MKLRGVHINDIWTTRDGEKIPIPDMHWNHLSNSINMLIRGLVNRTYQGAQVAFRRRSLRRLYEEVHRRCSQRR